MNRIQILNTASPGKKQKKKVLDLDLLYPAYLNLVTVRVMHDIKNLLAGQKDFLQR